MNGGPGAGDGESAEKGRGGAVAGAIVPSVSGCRGEQRLLLGCAVSHVRLPQPNSQIPCAACVLFALRTSTTPFTIFYLKFLCGGLFIHFKPTTKNA